MLFSTLPMRKKYSTDFKISKTREFLDPTLWLNTKKRSQKNDIFKSKFEKNVKNGHFDPKIDTFSKLSSLALWNYKWLRQIKNITFFIFEDLSNACLRSKIGWVVFALCHFYQNFMCPKTLICTKKSEVCEVWSLRAPQYQIRIRKVGLSIENLIFTLKKSI